MKVFHLEKKPNELLLNLVKHNYRENLENELKEIRKSEFGKQVLVVRKLRAKQ